MLLSILNLDTLEESRVRLGLLKVLAKNTDRPDSLGYLSYSVPTRITRSKYSFYLNLRVTEHSQ